MHPTIRAIFRIMPPPDAVHQMLKDELDLDGRPNLNLANFVETYMEGKSEKFMVENLAKILSGDIH